MVTEESLTDEYRRQLLRLFVPLAPVSLIGGAILVFSPKVWIPVENVGLDGRLHLQTPGWFLIGIMVIGTLCYLFAPRLGSKLAVVTNSYGEQPIAMPTSGQSFMGAGIVRGLALVLMYAFVVGSVATAW